VSIFLGSIKNKDLSRFIPLTDFKIRLVTVLQLAFSELIKKLCKNFN